MVRRISICRELPEELCAVLEKKAAAQHRLLDDVIIDWLARHPKIVPGAKKSAGTTFQRPRTTPELYRVCGRTPALARQVINSLARPCAIFVLRGWPVFLHSAATQARRPKPTGRRATMRPGWAGAIIASPEERVKM